ncbi:putative metal tolerance protein 4-like [Capsicum annuum]|nr:putative metal tolerance protein 4-like [Capsicum annuum]
MQLVAVSHLSGSFRRSFSNRTSITGGKDGKEEDRVGLVPVSPVSIPLKVEGSTKKITVSCTDAPKLSSKQTSSMKYSSGGIVSASSPSCHLPAPPVIKAKKGNDGSMSAPETPMLEPPNKRRFMSPDDDPAELPMKLARHLSTRRFSTDDDILDILPENLLQSKLTSIIPRIREKESEALAEQSSAISQDKRRKQMIARLPRLFDMIYFLFRSIKRSFMTKEELMHKVISGHLEITDRSEVEQKLILLQELAPEWIYEKPSSRGTILLFVNKISNPHTIRSKLAEAK